MFIFYIITGRIRIINIYSIDQLAYVIILVWPDGSDGFWGKKMKVVFYTELS